MQVAGLGWSATAPPAMRWARGPDISQATACRYVDEVIAALTD